MQSILKYTTITLTCLTLIFNNSSAQNALTDTLEQFFGKQLQNKKNSAYALYGLAYLNFERGNYKKAIAYAKENLKTSNDFDTACTVIYARSLEMTGRYNKAEQLLRKATIRFANSPDVWLAYSFNLYKLRKYAKSEQALETTIRLNPFMPTAHYLLGYCMFEDKYNPVCLQAWMFGLMMDTDTLRSIEIARTINYYLHAYYDSIRVPFFEQRLSLKYPDQFFFFNHSAQRTQAFLTQPSLLPMIRELITNIESYRLPSFYARFYRALSNENLLETYCHYAFRNLNRNELKNWYLANHNKLEQLAIFLDNYLNKPF